MRRSSRFVAAPHGLAPGRLCDGGAAALDGGQPFETPQPIAAVTVSGWGISDDGGAVVDPPLVWDKKVQLRTARDDGAWGAPPHVMFCFSFRTPASFVKPWLDFHRDRVGQQPHTSALFMQAADDASGEVTTLHYHWKFAPVARVMVNSPVVAATFPFDFLALPPQDRIRPPPLSADVDALWAVPPPSDGDGDGGSEEPILASPVEQRTGALAAAVAAAAMVAV